MSAKKLTQSTIIGQQAINLIERIVLSELGFVWRPTSVHDSGIDGEIEIRDSTTGIMTNRRILVQSRGTSGEFGSETESDFTYICSQDELEYWLQGNIPVIFIRSRPTTHEAYWISIKDYFKNPKALATRKIQFDKRKDRFDQNCKDVLIRLALRDDFGLYFPPPILQETLYSNLLKVSSFGKRIFIADTRFRRRRGLWKKLYSIIQNPRGEWILKNKRIISFHDLTIFPWSEICDRGTVEDFYADEWAYCDDTEKQRDFVQLLNTCLRSIAWRLELEYNWKEDYYYFKPTKHLATKRISYKAPTRDAKRVVFQAYPSKNDPARIAYYRHSALKPRFIRFEDNWFLEITPTYHYTRNGRLSDKFGKDRLKRIKEFERNASVLGQVAMWAYYLANSSDLFKEQYDFLQFGSLKTFNINYGISDNDWLGTEDEEEAGIVKNSVNDFPLFKNGN